MTKATVRKKIERIEQEMRNVEVTQRNAMKCLDYRLAQELKFKHDSLRFSLRLLESML